MSSRAGVMFVFDNVLRTAHGGDAPRLSFRVPVGRCKCRRTGAFRVGVGHPSCKPAITISIRNSTSFPQSNDTMSALSSESEPLAFLSLKTAVASSWDSHEEAKPFLLSVVHSVLRAVESGEKGIALSVDNPPSGIGEIKLTVSREFLAGMAEAGNPFFGSILGNPSPELTCGVERTFDDGVRTFQHGWYLRWFHGEPPVVDQPE